MIWVGLAVFFMVWAGATLLIDAGQRRSPLGLAERLRPYIYPSLAEEAEDWLRRQ